MATKYASERDEVSTTYIKSGPNCLAGSLDYNIPIREWSTSQVLEWMKAMKLYSCMENFKNEHINGADLADINESTLQEMGVSEDYQRKAIMLSIDQLRGRQSLESDSEGSSTESSDECNNDVNEHNFKEYTMASSTQKCHQCSKLLQSQTGNAKQTSSVQCSACGLCFHRECLLGKVRACNKEKTDTRKQKGHHSLVPDLNHDAAVGTFRVPDILYVCTKELERRCIKHPDLNVVESYKEQASTEDINKLKHMLHKADDIHSLDIRDVSPVTISGLIIKYLRGLHKPLIPTEFYEDFISAAKLSDQMRSVDTFRDLINRLPEAHSATLHFMMSHLTKISSHDTEMHNSRLALAQIFSLVFLRPDWPHLMNLVDNVRHHLTVVVRFFTLFDNNNGEEAISQRGAAAAAMPPFLPFNKACTTAEDHSLYESVAELKGAVSGLTDARMPLQQCIWYWGDVTREEVHEAMEEVINGTFLVRNATSHKTHGDYTLVLRMGGANLLIKVYHRNGCYGFCENTCTFSSVPELISHYERNSLSEYNPKLNTKLMKGLPKPGQLESLRSSDPQYLLKLLRKNHLELIGLSKACNGLMEKQKKLSYDIQLLHQAQDSYIELSKIFEEQIQHYTAENPKSSESVNHLTDVEKTEQLLKARIQSVNQNRDSLKLAIQERTGACTVLNTDISAMKPALRQLSVEQDTIISALMSHGITMPELEHILSDDSIHCTANTNTPATTSSNKHVDTHQMMSAWFRDCSRNEAVDLLKDCVDGTFLIRKGSLDNPYSLSIALNGSVAHCKILERNGLYGFAEPFLLYKTLVDLVLHYREHSLSTHNPLLNTKLLYPINTPEEVSS